MSRSEAEKESNGAAMVNRAAEASARGRFVLYVEGPRDCELLTLWAERISADLSRAVADSAVILGGRQPARALDHFRGLRGRRGRPSAVCVFDRDGGADPLAGLSTPPAGLEFYTWPRRHIESYLLVPDAIRRAAGVAYLDPRAERLLAEHVPSADDDAFLELDAKRLLHEKGPLARGLGTSLRPGRIAGAMHRSELHRDVINLLARVGRALGLSEIAPL